MGSVSVPMCRVWYDDQGPFHLSLGSHVLDTLGQGVRNVSSYEEVVALVDNAISTWREGAAWHAEKAQEELPEKKKQKQHKARTPTKVGNFFCKFGCGSAIPQDLSC